MLGIRAVRAFRRRRHHHTMYSLRAYVSACVITRDRDTASRSRENSIQIFAINFECLVACFTTIRFRLFESKKRRKTNNPKKTTRKILISIACAELWVVSCWLELHTGNLPRQPVGISISWKLQKKTYSTFWFRTIIIITVITIRSEVNT